MLFQQLLMRIFAKYENERTISAAFHILQGKRSGTTMQDVGLYKLFPYFGILRKLPRTQFDSYVQQLIADRYITVNENGYFTITEMGRAFLEK
ncbi:MAG: RQC domain-containing protein, partial [Lysinibacillus sp.]